ncbi:Golgi resident protein GCP60-like [Styela clava]|uniref:Golgi resident protein GCP60-like n=1 Tax=Styela clava TaxID=7725 RepID=UPI0019394F24|nr:Golgi resident protein GCP60-like [Styela clava]
MAEAMPAAVAVNNIAQQMNNVSLTEGHTEVKGEVADQVTPPTGNTTASYASTDTQDEESYWGFSLHEAYKKAIKFYKENEGKRTFDMSYEDKVYLAALTKQATLGPFAQQTQLPEVGYLDMFGNDRRRVWESLEDISSNDARRNFIKHLQDLAPVFVPFMTAHQKQKEEEERKRLEEERIRQEEEESKRRELEEAQKKEEQMREAERVRQEQERIQIEQKRQIMAALNEQTAQQFQQYAAQQYPGNPDQQGVLIAQLQEQHYQQYMQLYRQQQQSAAVAPQQPPLPGTLNQNPGLGNTPPQPQQQQNVSPDSKSEESDVSEESQPRIAEPSVWTRPQISEFKEQIKRDPESVLTVGRGEVVTVRVPTHEEGAYVFWEFATDYYDLGFGVYFEWSDSVAQQVSVHVNESSEEEGSEDEGEGDGATGGPDDIEMGSESKSNRPMTDEIVPVFRRECHTEVHAGSHRYPGRGVYLLKFDNSYSLWRSKTLYYRVYYTR